jgi:hypothetical protein
VPLTIIRSEATDTTPKKTPIPLPAYASTNVIADLARIREKMRIAKGEPEPEALTGEVFYIHTDQIGLPREVTNAEGNLVWRTEYKAWGRVRSIERPRVPVTEAVGNTVTQRWEEQAEPVEVCLRFQRKSL